ncbi:MAG TPA: S1/P1 nuclease [Gemmatimonadales bacterium]|nr:S1/P1 nuclease [Gemmatimonadales bacterium]
MLVLAFTLLASPPPVVAPVPPPVIARWGRVGHRVVARVAAARLSERARREVRSLLDGKSMAEIASWGDEIRSERPETGPWHYVNIPVTEQTYDPARHCPQSACVIGALERQVALLRDRSQPRAVRAEALKWVVHLVGDLHQPLHSGDRGDRGGNDVVVWQDFRRTNLHSLWDSGLINGSGMDEQQLVNRIESLIRQRSDLDTIARGSVTDWTMEAHDRARDVVYPELSWWLVITDNYRSAAWPVVEEQLQRAAVRLAAILETI